VNVLFAGNWTDLQVLIKPAGMNANHHAVLYALFTLAQTDQHATVLRVARSSGLSRDEVESSLAALDRAGLVFGERVRLTMQGLGAALMMGAPRARRVAPAKKAA
jgi:hypothetical protein